MEPWHIVEEAGLASSFHGDPMRNIHRRTCSFVSITRSALVLGSSQTTNSFRPEVLNELDAELVVRRSGGAAVYLEAGRQLWVDISIPKGDPLFRDDLAESFIPIGQLFVVLLQELGLSDIGLYSGRLERSAAASAICFAGLGPGEVTFEGAKVVGVAQRRTALGSVFQCTLYARYPHRDIVRLMGLAIDGAPIPGYALGVGEIDSNYSSMPNVDIVSDLWRRLRRLLV